MMFFIGILSGLILIVISIFHVYWAFGGRYAVDAVIPTQTNKKSVLNAPPFLTFLVAVFVMLIAITYLHEANFYDFQFLPEFIKEYGLTIFASIFFIRAVGDFKYVGFFKKIKSTKFGINDTKFFSPLCLFLALSGVLILILK